MRYLLALILLVAIAGGASAKTVSVNVHAANIHSTPVAYEYNIVLEAPMFYPLSVRGEKGNFFKTVDYLGRRGWVHKSVVDNTPAVIIKVPQANIRKGPGTESSILFKGKKGVTFKVLEKRTEWLKVRHESGQKGWIFRELTWGMD